MSSGLGRDTTIHDIAKHTNRDVEEIREIVSALRFDLYSDIRNKLRELVDPYEPGFDLKTLTDFADEIRRLVGEG